MDAARLEGISLFDGLSDEELAEVAAMFTEEEMLAGSSLAKEGDFSYKFFVVLEGQVEIYRDFAFVAELGPGEIFGEMGLVTGERRNARVTAKTRADLAWMMNWDFQKMQESYPLIAERIDAVIAERRAANTGES